MRRSVDSGPGIVRNAVQGKVREAEVDNRWMIRSTCSGPYLQHGNRLGQLIHKHTALTGTTTIVLF